MNTKTESLTQKRRSFPFCLSEEEIRNPMDVLYNFCEGTDLRVETHRLDRLLEAISKSGSENNRICYDLVDTEYRRLVEAIFLLVQNKTIEEVSIERFLGIFAHEIKDQLSGASIALESMIDKTEAFFSTRKDVASYLTTLRSILLNSMNMLTNMIMTAHFGEKIFTLRADKNVFRVAEFIDECTIPCHIFNETFNKALVIELNELRNRTIVTDRFKLMQVIKNLLSNAYKHSSGKEIKLVGTGLENYVSFSIISYGNTISLEDIRKIFKLYYQVNPGMAGDGVGLYLCELYAATLNGTISVTSDKGITVFTINIPCETKV